MFRPGSMFISFLSLIVAFSYTAEGQYRPSGRVKVWYEPPQYPVKMSSGSQTQRGVEERGALHSADGKERRGYYLDVDTTTDGTHQTFLVTTTLDTGDGSFLKAILQANNNPGLDYIHFSIGSGPQTLSPHLDLGFPVITSPVVIDGTTQPGYQGSPIIELDASHFRVEVEPVGLAFAAGNSTLRGLVINRCKGSGVLIGTMGGNVIQDCYIGTNLAGTDSLPNLGYGINIWNSPNNLIGDSLGAHGNVLSGNMYPHVAIEQSGAMGNMVMGNIIGLDKTGMADITGGITNGIFVFRGASHTIIGGGNGTSGNLISGNTYPNVAFNNSSYNIVKGNRVGMDWTGFGTFINGNAIYILNGSSNNIIGGTTPEERNLFTSTTDGFPGLMLEDSTTTNNLVIGNVIGAPPSRPYEFGNYDGVYVHDAPNNTIGGTASGARNLISGNIRHGILIAGSRAYGNIVQGNYIGAPHEPPVSQLLGNGGSGVYIYNAPDNRIGGSGAGEGNSISDNRLYGVIIRGDSATGNLVRGNLIGDDGSGAAVNSQRGNWRHGVVLAASQNSIGGPALVDGNIIAFNGGSGVYDSLGTKNLIRRNSIYSNDSLGIDLAPRGLTPNDPLDVDAGPNNLQNFPILDSARVISGGVIVHGKLNSSPNTTFTIEFFKDSLRDGSFFGEGRQWIGEASVTTNAQGVAPIDVTLVFNTLSSEFITATATDPDGNTSEFSRAVCMQDSDGDGIPDCWEREGLDVNCDGIIDLKLTGARPDHKDVYVEVDYMVGRQPLQNALASVSAAFAGVPIALVNNPDGGNGINLHLETTGADVIPLAQWAADPWPQFLAVKASNFGTAAERADTNAANILEAKKLVYRYCVFADRFPFGNTFPSGLARNIPSNDFMVTLGAFNPTGGSVQQQAGTFMHELGHTLGLKHGGGDNANFKPNYYSVMNYLFQLPQSNLPGVWRLSYSAAQLPDLFEPQLDEEHGLNPPAGVFPVVKIPYIRPDSTLAFTLLKPGVATDWDGDGDSTTIAASPVDVNFFNPRNLPSSPGETLVGFADWPNLKYNFRDFPGFPRPDRIDSTLIEMTPELEAYIQSLPPFGIESPLVYWSSDPFANIQVCTAARDQSGPRAVSDGDGGAYITWTDNRLVTPPFGATPACMVQRIDASGAVQWMNNGIKIAPSDDPQGPRNIMGDGNGGAIIGFISIHTLSPNQLRDELLVQKLNTFGQSQWNPQGVFIMSVDRAPGVVGIGNVEMASDGEGGTIFAWGDKRFGTYALFAQRVDASGVVRWVQGGVQITTTPFNYFDFQITSDGHGGAIIAWTDTRNGSSNYDIYAQRIDANGTLRWPATGRVISNASASEGAPVIAGNNSGGAIIAWLNYGSVINIFAQKVDSSGQPQWPQNGVQLTSINGIKQYLGITTDGSEGAILSWQDRRRLSGVEAVFAQRVTSSGVAAWIANGVALSNSDTNTCYRPVITSDGNHGAIVAFTRVSVSVQYHIFSQRVDSAGVVKWAVNGAPVSLVDAPKDNATVASDRNGEAIIAWEDRRPQPQGGTGYHIYAQNITSGGALGGGGTTSVNPTPPANVPGSIELRQNYPNPFNPTTTISYELPKQSHVKLTIYNILGQEITTLVNGIESPGSKLVRFNAQTLASGVYFYRLAVTESGSSVPFITVKKMMVIR